MGDYRAQSLSQRRRALYRIGTRLQCVSVMESLPGMQMSLGSDPESKAAGGTALKVWKEQELFHFFHRKEGKPGFHGTLPWVRLQPDEVRSTVGNNSPPCILLSLKLQRPCRISPILLSFLSFSPSSHPFASLASFLSSSAGSLLHPIDQLSDSDFLSFMLSSHSFIQI